MALELIVPGGIVFCLGVSTIFIAGLCHFNFLTEPGSIFLSWCLFSLFTSSISIFIMNTYFSGEVSHDEYDEFDDWFGKEVVVTENIDDEKGRISFQGTSWKAISMEHSFEVGDTVILCGKNNVTFHVEPTEGHAFKNINQKEV